MFCVMTINVIPPKLLFALLKWHFTLLKWHFSRLKWLFVKAVSYALVKCFFLLPSRFHALLTACR